jgi:hypothetical protein
MYDEFGDFAVLTVHKMSAVHQLRSKKDRRNVSVASSFSEYALAVQSVQSDLKLEESEP